MSLSSITSASFDGDLTDSDFNPIYDLIAVIGEVAEDVTEWYEETVDKASTGADWLNWLREAAAGDNTLSGQDVTEREEFTAWLDTLSFSPKYFEHNDDGTVKKINSDDYETSEVLELLSVQVDTLSTNANQVLIFTEALIDDYGDSNTEVKDLCDAVRSAALGHVSS
jgi:hypothetical protein